MAFAPLSQTVFLTEDGSIPTGQTAVVIPPLLPTLPSITTPASINSDGSPQVGETLTGIDPVFADATIKRRRWMLGVAVVATTNAFTPDASGAYDWSVDGIGTDGITPITSTSRIVVAAPTMKVTIAGVPPSMGKVGTAYSFLPVTANGAGTKVFSKNIPLLAGQTFSAETGAIGGTPTVSGTLTGLTITVTDDTGSAATEAVTVTIAPLAPPTRAFFSDPFFSDPFFRDAA